MAGPFSSVNGSLSQVGGQYTDKIWYTSAKPWKYRNNFHKRVATVVVSQGHMRPGDCYPTVAHPSIIGTQLYARFQQKLLNDSEAMLGVTLAEARQSFGMMSSRLEQLAGVMGLLQSNSWDLAALRRRKYPPKNWKPVDWRRFVKKSGNTWHEFWFGWSALLNDLYNGYVQTLKSVPPSIVKVRAKGSWEQITGTYPTGAIPISATGILRKTHKVLTKVQFIADVKVTNPNMYLLEGLGLANPAQIALELVSKSWLLNWFVTLNEYMSQFGSSFGTSVSNGAYTLLRTTETTILHRSATGQPMTAAVGTDVLFTRTRMDVPPGPSLVFRKLNGLSYTRGLTASALVVQYLGNAPEWVPPAKVRKLPSTRTKIKVKTFQGAL